MEAKVEDVLTQEISKDKNLFGLMYIHRWKFVWWTYWTSIIYDGMVLGYSIYPYSQVDVLFDEILL